MRRMCPIFVLLFALAPVLPLWGQNDNSELHVLLKQLITEIASLRSELRQQRLDRREVNISNLDSDLRQIQADKLKLDEQERAQGSEIAEFDERLQQPDIDPAERASLEAAKAKVIITVPEKLRIEKTAVLMREREIQDRLLRERQLQQALLTETKTSGR